MPRVNIIQIIVQQKSPLNNTAIIRVSLKKLNSFCGTYEKHTIFDKNCQNVTAFVTAKKQAFF